MASVTQRISEIKQPRGGYLPLRSFERIVFNDNLQLQEENISANLIGSAVDYLTRFLNGTSAEKAFQVSLLGAAIIKEDFKAATLLRKIKGLDSESVISACKLVGYDVCFRAGVQRFKNVDEICPDKNTVNNIVILVNRTLAFLRLYGPILKDGCCFEGGYSKIVTSGDCDFITKDALWDLKVYSGNFTSAHTLQLLMYYVLGLHSVHPEFQNVHWLGLFNPRKNILYRKPVDEISPETIRIIETEVIGYGAPSNPKPFATPQSKNHSHPKDVYDMGELMQILGCSRYWVMKYATESNLPLFKSDNRYYADRELFSIWFESFQETERKRKQRRDIANAVFLIGGLLFFVFIILVLLS